MDYLQYLLYPIAIYLLLIVATCLIIFQRLMKMLLQYPDYEIKAADDVPAHLQTLFQDSINELETLGFESYCYLQITSLISLDLDRNWGVLLYNKAYKTYAHVETRRLAEPVHLFDIEFLTFFRDKTLLVTVNGKAHGIIGSMPNTVVNDPYTVRGSDQWQSHQSQLAELSKTNNPVAPDPEQFLQTLQQHFKGYLDSLVKTKQITLIPNSEQAIARFQLTWFFALQSTIKIWLGSFKSSGLTKQRRQQAKSSAAIPSEIPLELEVEGFQQMQQVEQGRVKRKLGSWVLLGSFVLCVASFGTFFKLQTVLLLLGVILLHEAGHFLVMRVCGYQDTSIFFLPFFGGAATGRKDDATLTEKVWVLLAGPLPGLLLGLGLELIFPNQAAPSWLHEVNWMLIGVNVFNLLPIYPLDGGKIMHLLLFSRYPYTDVLFKLFAVIVLLLLGLSSPIILAIAAIVAVTIPLGFRSAKVDARLRKESSVELEPQQLLPAIFTAIKQSGYGTLPFAQRYQLAKDLLQRHREGRAKWTTRLALSVLYCASLIGGGVGIYQVAIATMPRNLDRQLESIQKERQAKRNQEIETATQQLRLNPQDASAYLKRAKARSSMQDYRGALEDYNQALRLNPKDIQAYVSRAQARYVMKDYPGTIADTTQAIQLDPKATNAYSLRSAAYYRVGDDKAALADRLKIRALYEDRKPKNQH